MESNATNMRFRADPVPAYHSNDMNRPSEINSPELHAAPGAHRRLLEETGRLPLLICGIAGVAGYNGFHHFRTKYGTAVLGQRPVRNWPLRGDGIVGCNLEDAASLKQLIEDNDIRTIWNCGGSCALKSCELDPEMAERVNVQGVANLLDAIEGTDVRLVHFSIDLVYSGTRGGNHTETDPSDPVTVYGKTMVAAERLILRRRPNACVLRISLPMGISFNGHAGAIDWIQARFANNKPATLYYDEVRTPTYVQCMNEVVEEVMAGDLCGLFHAGGTRKLSLYQIAQIVNRIGGYDPKWLEGCPRIDAGPIPPRAGNVSMDSTALAEVLGRSPFTPWPLHDWMVPKSLDWHYERPDDEQGSPELLFASLYNRPHST